VNLPNYNVEVDPDFVIKFPDGGDWGTGRRMSADAWRGLVGNTTIELIVAPQATDELKSRL
jgi:hypothetical protein